MLKGEITREEYELLLQTLRNNQIDESHTGGAFALDSTDDRRTTLLGGQTGSECIRPSPDSMPGQGNADIRELEAPGIPSSPFTGESTHTNESKGTSQSSRLLELLKDGQSHDTKEIMARVYKIEEDQGNCRIPSRINDLRKEGWQIPKARHVKGSLYAYVLLGKQQEPYRVS